MTQPHDGGRLWAMQRWYRDSQVLVEQFVRDEHNRLDAVAKKKPAHADWVADQQAKLQQIQQFADAADQIMALCLDLFHQGPEVSNHSPSAAPGITLPAVLEWLDYRATHQEWQAVFNHLTDLREKLRIVSSMSLQELQEKVGGRS